MWKWRRGMKKKRTKSSKPSSSKKRTKSVVSTTAASMVLKFDPRNPPYSFICDDCAERLGGVHPGGGCPAHSDVCGYCGLEKSLLNVRDYDYPAHKLGHIFD